MAAIDSTGLAELDALSPFELQTHLLTVAAKSGRVSRDAVLDAGKGQPNWLATAPRHAFHLFGRFAVDEAERSATHPNAGWHPELAGVGDRIAAFLDKRRDEPGADLLTATVELGAGRLGVDPDAWVGELVNGILGDRYPSPHRMLTHVEMLLHEYFVATHCAGNPPPGRFRLFATEGGAAAMTYCLQSLRRNGILQRGDRIAIGTPIFTPYLEIPTLEEFGFEMVFVRAQPELDWQYPASELERLRDRSIKAFFIVNPGNPGTRALAAEEHKILADIVASDRPDLLIITDTAYATFVNGFHSLLADLPSQTIGVHSFSKHFGATGSRIAFIAMHEDHAVDRLLGQQSAKDQQLRAERYRSVTEDPGQLAFVDRVVAESREVALYHIAGLSTPMQVQMALYASFVLQDEGRAYLRMTQEVLLGRLKGLLGPLGVPMPPMEDTHYYSLLDVLELARLRHGESFANWLLAYGHPLTFPIRLAEHYGVVALPGRGFEAASWSVRISLANLPDAAYPAIATAVHGVLDDLHATYTKETK